MRTVRRPLTGLLLLLLAIPGLAATGCGSTAPVEVGEARSGGDHGEQAAINTRMFRVTGVDEGDTVLFYPSGGAQRKAVANTVVFRFYEPQSVDDTHQTRSQLTIRKEMSFDKTDIFRRDHLIDISQYDLDKRINGAVRYTVTNVGSEAIEDFLIVDKLPEGFEVEDGGGLQVSNRDATPKWEIDTQGRIVIRESHKLEAKKSRKYTLPLKILIRPGAAARSDR